MERSDRKEKMKMQTIKIPVEKVVIIEKFYPRKQTSWQKIYEYSQAMKTGAEFPPICVNKRENSFILMDGRHRLEANKNLKNKEIYTEVYSNLSDQQMYEIAIKKNVVHGFGLSIQDRLEAVLKFRKWKYSDEQIGKLVQMPVPKMKELIGRRLTWTTTGQEVIMPRAFEGLSQKAVSNPDIRGGRNFRELAKELNAMLDYVKPKHIDEKTESLLVELKDKITELLSKT